jgi:NAD(P)-dependent dehydrogenase (short-subunit alcohol dehydrogenase family)
MQAKTVVVTGATSGLGAALAELLVKQNWQVLMINRSKVKSQAVVERLKAKNPNGAIEVFEADLADQAAIETVAEQIIKKYPRIDALFNNAGVLLGDLVYSRHKIEMHFQVNTLAPYMFMRLFRKPLAVAQPSAIVNVTSSTMALTGSLKIGELQQPAKLHKLTGAYAQSKLALTTLTNALAQEYQKEGIWLRSLDPGANKTSMTGGQGMPKLLLLLRQLAFQAPEKGAKAIYDAAFDQKFANQSGIYIASNRIKKPPKASLDPIVQEQLLGLCRELTGL